MRKHGILPAFACLKIVMVETLNIWASSLAVKARPLRSICSARVEGCPFVTAVRDGENRADMF